MIKIGKKIIGEGYPPFIIAEMSGNHNQSLNRALQLVDAAASCGVHAIKFQTYTPDILTLDINEREFHVGDIDSPWAGQSLYNLYAKAYTPWDWHKPLFERAITKGLIPFSTPFDETSVNFLEELGVPCYKISSFENSDHDLIKKVAKTRKPLIISTGMASIGEIYESLEVARSAGCKDIVLLKCTSSYPSTPENSNLLTIPHMKELFSCDIGISDHTLGIGVAVASVALGSTIIEKHFTLKRSDGGVDSTFSLEPHEMCQLVQESERAWLGLGKISYGITESEKSSLLFKRSLYVVKDINVGDEITLQNIRSIRPGYGMPCKYLEIVLGRRFSMPAKRGTALTWEMIG